MLSPMTVGANWVAEQVKASSDGHIRISYGDLLKRFGIATRYSAHVKQAMKLLHSRKAKVFVAGVPASSSTTWNAVPLDAELVVASWGVNLPEQEQDGDDLGESKKSAPSGKKISLVEGEAVKANPLILESTAKKSNFALFQHQEDAIKALRSHLGNPTKKESGMLVIPTGGGKTATAVHWIMSDVFNKGWKVIWIAHREQLLMQAAETFWRMRWLLRKDRRVVGRVVSGAQGFAKPKHVQAGDQLLITSIQTIHQEHGLDAVDRFLKGLDAPLLLVTDEAHHALARTYRKLTASCDKHKVFKHLGLTATPRRMDDDETRQLRSIFKSGDDGVIFEVSPEELWNQKILARPSYSYELTNQTADDCVTEKDLAYFRQYRELSTHMADTLANNAKRNAIIADAYKKKQKDYGKTLVFALNIPHCIQLNEAFKKRNIKSDFVVSHIEGGKSADATNREKIDQFREGKLDVLVNVQMLTEGVDIPDIKTVFLTRPTNSPVLLAQMIGRALRGQGAGGKKDIAKIVSFQDNWEHIQEWLYPEAVGPAAPIEETPTPERDKREITWISIEVLQRIARYLDEFDPMEGEFIEFVPYGWYSVDLETDDGTMVRRHIVFYTGQVEAFEKLEARLKEMPHPKPLKASKVEELAADLWEELFAGSGQPEVRSEDVEDVVKHWNDNDSVPPRFSFKERDQYSIEDLVTGIRARDLHKSEEDEELQRAFESGGLWHNIFSGDYSRFLRAYHLAEIRLYTKPEDESEIRFVVDTADDDHIVPTDLRKAVLERDGRRCLKCGCWRHLQIDHIKPYCYGGPMTLNNLQTLCKWCNARKGTTTVDYRKGSKSGKKALANMKG